MNRFGEPKTGNYVSEFAKLDTRCGSIRNYEPDTTHETSSRPWPHNRMPRVCGEENLRDAILPANPSDMTCRRLWSPELRSDPWH